MAAWLTLLPCVAVTPAAARQRLSFERGKVLSSYSHVVPKNVPLSIGGGIGKVAEVIIARREAVSLRLHFVVHVAPSRPTWALVVFDGDNRATWSHSPVADSGADFWSDEIRGGTAKVEVYSTEAGSALRLSIDKIAVSTPVTRSEAITPPDSRAPIVTQSKRVRDLGRAVARLRFIGDDDEGYYCTAVLVAPDLLMTSYHCPQSDGERRSTLVDFDFDSDNEVPKTLRIKSLLIGDSRLDFALYRLSDVLADRPSLKLDERSVVDGQALILIQHPAGEPKQVSLLDCRVNEGRAESSADFGHLCDTLGGSSGSPVLDERTGLMLGLHHIGFRDDSQERVNRAVSLTDIADHLRRRGRFDLLSAMGLDMNRRRGPAARRLGRGPTPLRRPPSHRR
jgi:hypothetical protein